MDNKLQTLKRFLPENSPQLLNEKLRAGELTIEQVKLASQLDYKPARQLFPNEELVDWSDWYKQKDFLAKFDKSFLVSLTCDFAERVISIWEEYDPKDTRPQGAIKAARKWVENPSEENRQLARNAAAYAAYAADAAYAAYAANAAAAAAYAADAAAAASAAAANAAAAAAAAAASAAAAAANAASAAYYAADSAAYYAAKKQELAWQKEHLARLILEKNG